MQHSPLGLSMAIITHYTQTCAPCTPKRAIRRRTRKHTRAHIGEPFHKLQIRLTLSKSPERTRTREIRTAVRTARLEVESKRQFIFRSPVCAQRKVRTHASSVTPAMLSCLIKFIIMCKRVAERHITHTHTGVCFGARCGGWVLRFGFGSVDTQCAEPSQQSTTKDRRLRAARSCFQWCVPNKHAAHICIYTRTTSTERTHQFKDVCNFQQSSIQRIHKIIRFCYSAAAPLHFPIY